jgi:hypothetical protein
MHPYSSLCDDFYVNLNLSTEMDLPASRETILHFFERLQKEYPTMRNFYSRDKGDFILEEDKESGQYRWATIEARRLSSGMVNPNGVDDAMRQHKLILDLAPFMLSASPLDCEALDLLYGFDFTYRGNHNQLIAEALGLNPAFEKLAEMENASVIGLEPSIVLSLDEDCRTQCRVSVVTRTSEFHVRSGEYPEEQLSVYVTARWYGSLEAGSTFETTLERLHQVCREVVDECVVESMLRPLRKTIALK